MSEPTPEQQRLAKTVVGLNQAMMQGYIETLRPVTEAFSRDMANFAEALRREQERAREIRSRK